MTEDQEQFPRKKFTYGDAFVEDPIGSAPMVNLDGRWEHDFVDDPTPAGQEEEAWSIEEGLDQITNSRRNQY